MPPSLRHVEMLQPQMRKEGENGGATLLPDLPLTFPHVDASQATLAPCSQETEAGSERARESFARIISTGDA